MPHPAHCVLASLLLLALLSVPAIAAKRSSRSGTPLWSGSVNGAEIIKPLARPSGAALSRVQILLDREHFSPGEIDGNFGENTRKAVRNYRETKGLGGGDRVDEALLRALVDSDGEPALVTYRITEENDPQGFSEDGGHEAVELHESATAPFGKVPHERSVPAPAQPGGNFDRPRTEIVIANVQRDELPAKVARIEVDATGQRVLAYDKDGQLVAAYPATVGSTERPSPRGEMKVTAIAKNPTYHYDPSLNFKGVHADQPLDLPPGPNNPIGLVWIALSGSTEFRTVLPPFHGNLSSKA